MYNIPNSNKESVMNKKTFVRVAAGVLGMLVVMLAILFGIQDSYLYPGKNNIFVDGLLVCAVFSLVYLLVFSPSAEAAEAKLIERGYTINWPWYAEFDHNYTALGAVLGVIGVPLFALFYDITPTVQGLWAFGLFSTADALILGLAACLLGMRYRSSDGTDEAPTEKTIMVAAVVFLFFFLGRCAIYAWLQM